MNPHTDKIGSAGAVHSPAKEEKTKCEYCNSIYYRKIYLLNFDDPILVCANLNCEAIWNADTVARLAKWENLTGKRAYCVNTKNDERIQKMKSKLKKTQ